MHTRLLSNCVIRATSIARIEEINIFSSWRLVLLSVQQRLCFPRCQCCTIGCYPARAHLSNAAIHASALCGHHYMIICLHACLFAHAGFVLRFAGVKSGTNIIEDVLLLQLQQLALQLHTLTVNDAAAANVLVYLVAKMSHRHLQQLQVSTPSG